VQTQTTQNIATKGFTLFEAIVALTVMAVGLIPILTLLSQSATLLARADASNITSQARLSAVAYLETVNPYVEPTGRAELGAFEIVWTSSVLKDPQNPTVTLAGLRGYEIGLYQLNVQLVAPPERPFDQFSLEKVGYRRQNTSLGGTP